MALSLIITICYKFNQNSKGPTLYNLCRRLHSRVFKLFETYLNSMFVWRFDEKPDYHCTVPLNLKYDKMKACKYMKKIYKTYYMGEEKNIYYKSIRDYCQAQLSPSSVKWGWVSLILRKSRPPTTHPPGIGKKWKKSKMFQISWNGEKICQNVFLNCLKWGQSWSK